MNRQILFFFVFLFLSISLVAQKTTTPSNALVHYLQKEDSTYNWVLKDSFALEGVKGYDLLLVSQQWKHYTWKHQLTIFSPKENIHDGALLFITGGHNDKKTGTPHWKKYTNDFGKTMGKIAMKNKAIVAVLKQVPNEPLFDSLVEDQIISYTLHRFLKDTDYTWPLLFPMVKSAEKGMDAVQEFANNRLEHPVERFVISGASKRGWTTWLTAAIGDTRVAAIAPMVIDILNMPVNLAHQMKAYGAYSKEIKDYVNLGIVQGIASSGGRALVEMIDPYSYREKLTQPKMIFMGTNDPYWVVDNVKNYLSDIPGYNLLNYTPNAGHDLNDGILAFPALSAFFGITMNHGTYPECSWETKRGEEGVQLIVHATKDKLLGAKIWSANAQTKDFRQSVFHSRELSVEHQSVIKATEPFPLTGYHAFYMALTYESPNGGSYQVCTRVFMMNTAGIL